MAFSPDGDWIAFHDAATGHVRKVPVEGGLVETVGPTSPEGGIVSFRGLTWGSDGTLVFSADDQLMRIPATGGEPEPLTSIEPGEAVVATQPEFLPDGAGVVFTMAGTAFPFRRQVAVLRFGHETIVLTDGHSPRVTRDGLLIVARGSGISTLWAAPLTEDYTALAGEPRPVFEEVGSGDRAGTFARGGFFDIATDGALAFLPPRGGPRTPWSGWTDAASPTRS